MMPTLGRTVRALFGALGLVFVPSGLWIGVAGGAGAPVAAGVAAIGVLALLTAYLMGRTAGGRR